MIDPCLGIALPQFFALNGAITFPTAIQINSFDTARWLMVLPGIANQAGTASPGGLEWRLYKGLLLPTGGWKISYGFLPANPVAAGSFLSSSVIPWGDELNYVLELNGAGTWGAGSVIELAINAFTPNPGG